MIKENKAWTKPQSNLCPYMTPTQREGEVGNRNHAVANLKILSAWKQHGPGMPEKLITFCWLPAEPFALLFTKP